MESSNKIMDAINHIQEDFPAGYLAEIRRLTECELKYADRKLGDVIYLTLMNWLENNTEILEHCGSYSKEEVCGYFLGELWCTLKEKEGRGSLPH